MNAWKPSLQAAAHRLATWQTTYPLRFLGLGLVVIALALPSAMTLRMNGAFSALLPETARSVRDLEVISKHVGINSTLAIAVSGPDRKRVLDYTRLLGRSLEDAQFGLVNRVDYQVADFVKLVESNRMLYLSLPELRKLNDSLTLRLEADRRARDPFDLGLDDEIDAPSWDELERQGRSALERETGRVPRYEQGLFAHSKENFAVIFVRTGVQHGDVPGADLLLRDIDRLRQSLGEASGDLRVDYGGDLMDATHETKALARQMMLATLLTVALVGGAILFFFRSLRAIPLLCGFLIPPLAATAAFAALTVEYLNTSTAFLMSIVIGNGVNPGVMWLSRYFEERRGGSGIADAVLVSHLGCFQPTFVASGAAALAYGSLVFTDFRGFRDFGVIGGVGMVLCWLSAVVLLPALTVGLERLRPIRVVNGARSTNNPYGHAFRQLALWRPRLTLGVAFLVTSLALFATIQFLAEDPFEYDFRKLTSLREPGDRIAWVNVRQSEVAPESQVGNALLMRAPHASETPRLTQQLEEYSNRHPRILGPVRDVHSLLPSDQPEKLRILLGLRERLESLMKRANDKEKQRLQEFLPPKDLRALTIADLPDDVVRTFREKDGTTGRLLHIEHHPSRNRWDGAYWMEWVRAARSVRVEGSREVAVTGNPVIFADMLSSIRLDAPRSMLVSFGATVILICLSLRRRRNQIVTVCALLLGILWMVGGMAALDLKFHFLNLLAFPIALGNGVDYAVNVVQRFEVEHSAGKDALAAASVAISETGGAVVLCSLTTIFGYLSIHVSQNQALRSFAMAMAIAEWTCLLAAVAVVPAWLATRSRPSSAKSVDVPSLRAV